MADEQNKPLLREDEVVAAFRKLLPDPFPRSS